ncbi:hypothetical protein PtrSN002B_003841 [Pyrenophora tritici-repentis]|uniref:Uncharacterized protein n=2 Tax=Pyrenophora tritici-repentis TaxID=45151 RepID=A0A2W1FC83_9PLEO|nr:uncharacterized protein PTRG_09013 [Pyrenophora tritici-repentis Pt-1C-BFP]KAA8627592.1 hypothetical protein PtrV1_03272 [Pyrenophora tritici-repentis]EDU42064.1 conserved hypothetical protein [Pyrenophora tritici-repentis Pt-1C-BFP]KAF7442377.1 hypothetical protein A1F99_132460 [Pyrenophora tritici-repentis]KAF7579251.1 hypothetical protein PtrM4_034910 [Pyrenophora tritici-repentis]KAG9378179.1 hypothetical protein A1F94_011295 [Pyrenophora tritici-repentis]
MPALPAHLVRRVLDFGASSQEFSAQWKNPSDVFSVLLILGGDVVARALAQLAGSGITPVAFSFGWVAYAVTAVVSAVGENKLMPLPDCACKVINGKTGYVRDNCSWVLGRIVRDYESWMDAGNPNGAIHARVNKMIDDKWAKEMSMSGSAVEKPTQAGLCVSVYSAEKARPGHLRVKDYIIGLATAVIQLLMGAIPCFLFGDWSVLLVTAAGMFLVLLSGSLSQWAKEKWACRKDSKKTVILTRGNGSQHAIVIIGQAKGLDLEDLAAGPMNVNVSASYKTRVTVIGLALCWILLLITAAGIQENTWFLLAVGGIGIVQNVFVAGWKRRPEDFGIPLKFEKVIGDAKVMECLLEVEKTLPYVGRSMRDTFFPGTLRPEEKAKWDALETNAKDREKDMAKSS